MCHNQALDCYQEMTKRVGTRVVSSWLLLGVAQQMTNRNDLAIESFKSVGVSPRGRGLGCG